MGVCYMENVCVIIFTVCPHARAYVWLDGCKCMRGGRWRETEGSVSAIGHSVSGSERVVCISQVLVIKKSVVVLYDID